MHLVDLLPVIVLVGAFAICFGSLIKEYLLSRWA